MDLHALERFVPLAFDLVPEVQVARKYALHLLVGVAHTQTGCCHKRARKQHPSKLVAVDTVEVCCTGQHSMELYMVLSRWVFHDQQA